MSIPAEPILADLAAPEPSTAASWTRVERLLERLGDRLNPILVKEARQALKSRQFLVTFTLLLACGWIWSILGLGWGNQAAYSAQGFTMFAGYYVILALPLVVIVPFGAFRSLATEQEDRTYELMSITALAPRQIVAGKLGCAVAQMLIYLSAITPCLAFTYLLRGIDVFTIAFGVVFVVLLSLGLSVISLTLGTLSGERHWQVLLSIALIVGLLVAFGVSTSILMSIIQMGVPVDTPEFWQGMAAAATAYVSYFVLFFCTAVARITFATDNRSTRLRVIMVVQHMLFAGWMTWVLVLWPDDNSGGLVLMAIGLLIHWSVMGIFMTGESPQLSLRVRRSLPQSLLGRMLFTWFNPGPGTGYVLAVSGGIGALALVTLLVPFSRGRPGADIVLAFAALSTSYLVIYLGIGLLILRGLRRLGQWAALLPVLIHALVVMLGCGLPLVLEMSFSAGSGSYSYLQMPNFFWTLVEFADGTTLPVEAPVVLTLVPLAALVVFAINLPGIVREVQFVRVAKPSRVVEEDTEMAAQVHPPELVQVSPWDMELRQ
jgi:hypothetical protein